MTSSPLRFVDAVPLACVLFAGLVLSACSSDGNNDWRFVYDIAKDAIMPSEGAVSLDDAAKIPFSTIGVRVNGGKEQILVLATDSDGRRLWVASSTVAVMTAGGRIVRTAGFGADLNGFSTSDSATDWNRPHSWTWQADYRDLGLFSVPVTCSVTPVGPEPIQILSKTFDTIRVDENCQNSEFHVAFSNSFWVSTASGRVWRSIQQVHPKGPTFEIEILRPPLTDE